MPSQNRETQRKTVSTSFRDSWSCSFSTDSVGELEEERTSSAVGLRRKRNSSRTGLYPETIQSVQQKHNSLREEGNCGVEAVTKQLAYETFDFSSSNPSRRRKAVFGNIESLEKQENFQKLLDSCSPGGSLPSECIDDDFHELNSSSVFYSTQSSNGNGFPQTSRVITDSSEYIADSEENSVQNISLPKMPRRAILLNADSGGVPPKRRREIVSRVANKSSEGPSTIATTRSYSTITRSSVKWNNSVDSFTQEAFACSGSSQTDGVTLVSCGEPVNSELHESISITSCFPVSLQTEPRHVSSMEQLSSTPSEERESFQDSHVEQTEEDTCGSVSSVRSTEGLTTELYSPYEKFTENGIVQSDFVDDSSDMYDELTYLVQNCEVTEPKNKCNGFLPYIW
ncbi:uncharacterized protein Gasu_01700 [Galdieria sulphuraria]|uniref:Uncharacterized protein n=1 Tax=Galdieria sulphuraria TaxID=130081 RepID=M2WA87_GALSU|nr:uncharacterized protein Gasu_01700 [Galdieria sulphuraria]EME32811.1 hypothetical protein Gasu_01700 [Galdieria sulphuraria]|eukprot:XP_005709331.1 hypothetical protein Gasu_01700 [Galdieria sulphuraria]